MSLRPGLMASTSALPLATRGARVQWVAAVRQQQLQQQLRSLSTSAPVRQEAKSGKPASGSMQAVEKQVEEHKRQMRRMPSMVDITGLYEEMIFDRELDPPFSPSWITKSGVMGYMGSRMKRLIGSKQHMDEAGERGLFPGPIPRFGMFRGLTRYFGRLGSPYPELIPNLEHIYLQYQEAQATGDAQSVQALSMGQASKRGLRVARAIRKGKSKWELVKTNAKPKLLMVRAGAMDASGTGDMAVQVVVRFDTLQRLTLAGKVNEVRVVENVVFDKREGGVNTFRIKDTLPFMQPEFLQKSS